MGEFAARAQANQDGVRVYPGYVFNGEFREIRCDRLDLQRVYPSAISDDKTVSGQAYSSAWGWFGFLHRDGITVRIDEILPNADVTTSVAMSSNRRILTESSGESINCLSL